MARKSPGSADAQREPARTVVLVGNPNTGKSTLFSALVGVRQRVGNYPGVTVEKRSGSMELDGHALEVVDLPGLYSLSPRSEDEAVTCRALLGCLADSRSPDLVICVVDASNPRRNLYLISQVLELGLPTLVVFNMLDIASQEGWRLDLTELEARLNVPVVGVQALRGLGLDDLRQRLARMIEACRWEDPASERAAKYVVLPDEVEAAVQRLAASDAVHRDETSQSGDPTGPFVARRLLLDPTDRFRSLVLGSDGVRFASEAACEAERHLLRSEQIEIPRIETAARYAWVDRALSGVAVQTPRRTASWSDRLDHLLTHRVLGLIVFVALMVVVFLAVFSWAAPVTALVGGLTESASARLRTTLEGAGLGGGVVEGILCDGAITGVGSVLEFLPQILTLFFFIGLLEDCGYMARAAFLMDRMMSRVGLCGKAFIPLLSCYACAVPGIMATRVIDDPRNRLTTILVAPFMTCSARLPIYVMLVSAFVPARFGGVFGARVDWLKASVFMGLYAIGVLGAIGTALLLKRSVLRGGLPCFVLELPNYKWPSPRAVFHRVAERGWQFVRSAGTIIFVASVLMWAALYFPRNAQRVEADPEVRTLRLALESEMDAERRAELEARLDRVTEAAYQRDSLLGRFGRTIEPVFHPLGWDWRIGCSVMASFPAREVVVAALAVSFPPEGGVDETDEAGFRARLTAARWPETGEPLFNLPVALSLMVFFALCCQCSATLATMRRETGDWRWPIVSFVYMTGLAYLGALLTYQAGMWLGW